MALEFWKSTSLFTAGNISCSENSFGFFYRFFRCAGVATQVSNFRFKKFKTLKWTIPSLSDLEFAEQKEKAVIILLTRRYVIKTNHCELSWQPTAAVAKQGQVSFFTFFFSIWSNEHDACLIIRGMNGCMYLAREKSYLCFFLDESGFCWFAHPVIEIEHQWPTDQATTTITLVGVGPARAISKRNSVFLAILPKSSYYSALVHFPQRCATAATRSNRLVP